MDFGYNIPEDDPEAGLEETSGDLNDLLLGLDVPIQLTDSFSIHFGAHQSIALDVLEDLGQDDEFYGVAGLGYSF